MKEGANIKVQKVKGWWKDTGMPDDLLEANRIVLSELKSYNDGSIEENVTLNEVVGIGNNTVIHGPTTLRGPVIIGEGCEIGPDVYVGPYTSIGDNVKIMNTEIENSIVMEGTNINCGNRITDSLIGKDVNIISYENNIPKGHKLIIGDRSYITL